MSIGIYIPIWLLWTLGIAGGLLVLLLAGLGIYFLFVLREFNRSWNRTWGW